MTQQIKITWKAFGDKPQQNKFVTSVEIETEFPATLSHNEILNVVYADTNLYQGYIWGKIEGKLSPIRTHTSLSIGDEVVIDGIGYVVGDFGFIKIEDADIEIIEIEGRKIVFSVKEKVSQ